MASRRPRASTPSPVSADVARQHFQELLEAKQERLRQGPSYPPANDFTGQRSVDGSGSTAGSENAALPAPPDADKPAPEATFGEPSVMHGRGNQGMRPQK
jgi:hypothetical protein